MKTAIIFERYGEYHHARLAASTQQQDIIGIEIARQDTTYQWSQTNPREGYMFKTLVDHIKEGPRAIVPKLNAFLDKVKPDVIAVPGWAPFYSHAAIKWAFKHDARIVVMTDSNQFDARRFAPAEQIKRSLLKFTSAAFASGQHASDYLEALGVSKPAITLGYNCVDNAHFKPSQPRQADLIPKSFLAVGRLVERKNFHTLLEAYKIYLTLDRDTPPWQLVILGDGPEKDRLIYLANILGLSNHVSFEGFAQYNELPAYYHRASAFVLASQVEQWGLVVNEAMAAGLPVLISNQCGCVRDLVVDGKNGFTFAPDDPDELARRMHGIATSPDLAQKMGENSAQLIKEWSPSRFGEALCAASELALAADKPRPSLLDHAIFNSMRALSYLRQ